ncbi:hypothetical protein OTU49_004642 [Cherax quadricarinatus]|uniref:Solute carrier family 23 member 2 n=1 Tax=Cherax quadricarinatus TaxID=27406 RepID=A0AAW0XAV3_CHEQU
MHANEAYVHDEDTKPPIQQEVTSAEGTDVSTPTTDNGIALSVPKQDEVTLENATRPTGPNSTQPDQPTLNNVVVVPVSTYSEELPSTQPQISQNELVYTVDDVPPWYMCIFLGLQHYLTMVGGTITIPFILTPLMCIDDNDPVRGKIVSTIIFVSGMITLLQATFGVRLPIVQGGTFSFLVPTIAILTTTFDTCDLLPLANMTAPEREEVWQERMREVQGAIVVSALFQVLVGFTGVIGILLKWITPLTIVPTVTLVGLSLFDVAANKASLHWGISFMTIALIIIFSQYMMNVPFPFPTYSKSVGFGVSKIQIFKLFPVLLAIIFSWGFCAILTTAGVFPAGNKARTDLTTELLGGSPWFRIPYPCQWGLPTVSISGVFGMVAGVLASMVESVGDYYACARIAGAPPPPLHAINRGIGIEGIGCIIAGLWGTGNGTTSYSENIGAIGVTKWMEANPGMIQTGEPSVNQILTVLLQTSMFVGGLLGILLDNTIPGTHEERGLLKWNAHLQDSAKDEEGSHIQQSRCYDIPVGMDALRKWSWSKQIPICPTFTGFGR